MLKRRDFLRGAVGTFAALNALKSFSWAATDENPAKPKDMETEPMWRRTIFCQFDNPTLKEATEGLARDSDCDVYYGTSGYTDIYAVPCFIAIVDRNLVGEDIWGEYLKFCAEVNDDKPCIIVDGMKHLGLPKYKYVSQFDMNDPASIHGIREIIISHLTLSRKFKVKYGTEGL